MKLVVDARKAFDGGIGRYIRCLTRALLDAEASLVLSLLMPRSMPSFLPESTRITRVDYDTGLYSLAELINASGHVRRAAGDLFHEPHYVLPFRVPIPSVVTIHDTIHLEPGHLSGPLQRGYARLMLASASRRADHVITVSESARGDIVRHTGIDPTRVTVTQLGVEPRFFDIHPEMGARARHALALSGDFVLFVGAFKQHKNPIGLCEAFLAADLPDARLVMIGSGTEDVGAWAAARGVGSRILVASVDDADLLGLYREARLFVLPSLYEGFGLPLLEAMAAGVPAIASRAASIPEVGGDAPVYVPPGDVGALARALRRLWQDESERRTRTTLGRERARTLTWERTAASTLEVYRRVSLRAGAYAR